MVRDKYPKGVYLETNNSVRRSSRAIEKRFSSSRARV